jgi:hypothetical protein
MQGKLKADALFEYLQLWDILSTIELCLDIEDKHIWRLSSYGQYCAKSSYEGFFQGVSSLILMSEFENLGRL